MNREKLFRDMIYHGTLKEEYCYYYFYEKMYQFYHFHFFHCWTKKLSTDMLIKKLSTDMFLQQKFSKSPKKHVLPLENIVNPAPLLRFINTCCTLIVLLARFHLARLTTI